jgi:hypothetical protein
MSKEASRIRRIIGRLKSREDIAEILKMAQGEVVRGLVFRDLRRLDRGVAICEAAEEALAIARLRPGLAVNTIA